MIRIRRLICLTLTRDARQAGASIDSSEVFRRMLRQGQIGADFDANYRLWFDENPDLREAVVVEAGRASPARTYRPA